MNAPTLNEFRYTGIITEVGDPLLNEKSGEVLGTSVKLAQLGMELSCFVSSKLLPLDELETMRELTVTGRLVPASTGWPKVKVTGATLGAEAKA